MKKLSELWIFRLVVKILIPVSFFIIAAAEGKAFQLAGVMTILTIAYYVLQYEKIGENKYK